MLLICFQFIPMDMCNFNPMGAPAPLTSPLITPRLLAKSPRDVSYRQKWAAQFARCLAFDLQ